MAAAREAEEWPLELDPKVADDIDPKEERGFIFFGSADRGLNVIACQSQGDNAESYTSTLYGADHKQPYKVSSVDAMVATHISGLLGEAFAMLPDTFVRNNTLYLQENNNLRALVGFRGGREIDMAKDGVFGIGATA